MTSTCSIDAQNEKCIHYNHVYVHPWCPGTHFSKVPGNFSSLKCFLLFHVVYIQDQGLIAFQNDTKEQPVKETKWTG